MKKIGKYSLITEGILGFHSSEKDYKHSALAGKKNCAYRKHN